MGADTAVVAEVDEAGQGTRGDAEEGDDVILCERLLHFRVHCAGHWAG